ncbi:MAG: DMT family transporter [Candidatus Latescibacteria bacterium]|nr:DMT family transporter [Candidatus Latescibacterota bacterium]
MTDLLSLGELCALGSALLWAVNSMMLRTRSHQVSPAAMNVIRCGTAALFFWIWLPFSDPLAGLEQVSTDEWLLLVGSIVVGMVTGDTLYLTAIREIGLSRALALSSTYPLTTLLFEWLLLRRPASGGLALGCCLVALGVVLLSGRGREPESRPLHLKYGVALALVASVLWGLSTVMLYPAVAHLTLVQANSVRMPLVALLLYLIRIRSPAEFRCLDRRTLLVVAGSGLIGMGISSLMYLAAIKLIGATKAVTLTSVSPVFGMILSVVFLKEQVGLRVLLGIAACMGGVWLVL